MTEPRECSFGAIPFEGLPPGFGAGYTILSSFPACAGPAAEARRLARFLGVPDAPVARARQVHGRGVLSASSAAVPGSDEVLGDADAIVTRELGRLVAVSTADCVPIVLLDPGSGWVAAVHAGWRGTALRILDVVLDRLEAEGGSAGTLHAFFGPSISRGAYEVGPEVVRALRESHAGIAVPSGATSPGRGDRTMLDLAAFCEALLLARGVERSRLSREAPCTFSSPGLLPSYRRDGADAGRILTGVVRLPR